MGIPVKRTGCYGVAREGIVWVVLEDEQSSARLNDAEELGEMSRVVAVIDMVEDAGGESDIDAVGRSRQSPSVEGDVIRQARIPPCRRRQAVDGHVDTDHAGIGEHAPEVRHGGADAATEVENAEPARRDPGAAQVPRDVIYLVGGKKSGSSPESRMFRACIAR